MSTCSPAIRGASFCPLAVWVIFFIDIRSVSSRGPFSAHNYFFLSLSPVSKQNDTSGMGIIHLKEKHETLER